MSDWIDLGEDTAARYDDIVAVHSGCDDDEQKHIKVKPWADAKAIVIMRNGEYIPAYVAAKTVRKRLREAEAARQTRPRG